MLWSNISIHIRTCGSLSVTNVGSSSRGRSIWRLTKSVATQTRDPSSVKYADAILPDPHLSEFILLPTLKKSQLSLWPFKASQLMPKKWNKPWNCFRPFECTICGLKVSTSSDLNKHMRRHTGKNLIYNLLIFRLNFELALFAYRWKAIRMHSLWQKVLLVWFLSLSFESPRKD